MESRLLAVGLALLLAAAWAEAQQPAGTTKRPAGPSAWKKRWVIEGDFGGDRTAPVALAPDGTAYVVVDEGADRYRLRAIGADGKDRWACPLDDDALAAPAVAPGGRIVLGLLDGTVVEVSAEGKPLGRARTGGPVYSAAAFGADGTAYFGSRDDRLYAWKDGSVRWSAATGGWVDGTPALAADGTVYAASRDGSVRAFAPDGRERWKVEARRPVVAGPVVGPGGAVFAGAEDGFLYSISPAGKLLWSRETKGWVHFAPCIDDAGNVSAMSAQGVLYSLNAQGGVRWELEVGQPESAPVCDGNGTIFVCAKGGVQAVSVEGKPLWSHGDLFASSLALAADGALYVKSTQRLYCIAR